MLLTSLVAYHKYLTQEPSTEQVPRGQQHGHNTSWHPEQVGQGDLDSAEVAIASEPESDPDKSDSDDSVYQTADDDNDSEREAA